ncbi:hypothetical protein C8Q72DRAFT_155136 [Fomitopsis betulina]|nr:hypothetical protein C8Q72DRAFT_155136 [Fomitopsis betulina]
MHQGRDTSLPTESHAAANHSVSLAFQLLNSISSLPPTLANSMPIYQRTRDALRLLGRVYSHLLKCYMEVTLSLREQLEHLSAVAHLLLALYMQDKGGVLPAILYLDVQIMVKNVYFCLAKILVDNPDGFLWIICLGTDALEKIFSLVRTMIGADANADQLQLTSRMSGAIQCSQILQEHPEWDRGSRHLAIPSLDGQGDRVALSADNVNPKSWVGNVSVKGVLPQTCWYHGRHLAESDLEEFGVTFPLCDPQISTGSETIPDLLRPFGDGKLVYLGGLRIGDTTEEQLEIPAGTLPTVGAPGLSPTPIDDCFLEPDLEDLLGSDDAVGRTRSGPGHAASPKVESWLAIDDQPGSKTQHKSTFVRLLSQNPGSFASPGPGSTNCLGRVCGFTRYGDSKVILDADTEAGQPMLGLDDPAITLVRVDGLLFLAVIQICDIKCAGQSTCSLKVEDLALDNVRIKFEILSLHSIVPTPDNCEADWEWTGCFASTHSTMREVKGQAIQLIDPQLTSDITVRVNGKASCSTYQFRTFELRALACELFQSDLLDVSSAEAPRADSFPYQTVSGSLCFLCETQDTSFDSTGQSSKGQCPLCPDHSLVSTRQQSVLLNHLAAHIVHDHTLVDPLTNPCGFCLSSGDTCAIYLKKSRGAQGGFSVDMLCSRCPHKYKLSVSAASSSTPCSPSTNVPLCCPLCPKGAQVCNTLDDY